MIKNPQSKHTFPINFFSALLLAVFIHLLVALGILWHTGYFEQPNDIIKSEFIPSSIQDSKPEPHHSLDANQPNTFHRRSTKVSNISQSSRVIKIYTWINENGVKSFSNYPPTGVSDYKVRKIIDTSILNETKIKIIGNQIIVPVKLGYLNKTLSASLLLDTGSSNTLLYKGVAELPNIRSGSLTKTRLADGRVIPLYSANIDYIIIGPYKIDDFQISIVDYHGVPETYQGLLGMDFLKDKDYHVDFNRKIIVWGRL